MQRFREFAHLLYMAAVRPGLAVAATFGVILTIGLLVTQHFVPAIPFALATALLVACLATSS